MVFRNFDRLVFAVGEGSSPGTAATITTANDFFETIEPTFTITPLMFERFQKSQTLTTQVQTVPGSAKATPVATCEMSFGIELAGPGSGVSGGTAPKIDRLLRACGFAPVTVVKYAATATSYTGGPFFHNESVDGVSSGGFVSAEAKSFSCNAFGDAEFLAYSPGGASLGGTTVKSQHSGAECTVVAAKTDLGVGYVPATAYTDDTTNTTLTIRMIVGGGGEYVEMKGAKGTFEINFVHGDRVVINFTFTGVLEEYKDAAVALPADHSYTAEVPPAWVSTGMKVQEDTSNTAYWETSLFNALTLTLGNEVTVREDTNSADGYAHAIITGRAPQLTWNPDAVVSGTYDFWDKFLAGKPQRMRWTVGTAAGNTIEFRVTSAQFSGIADGDRDSVSILDTTTMLTGGSFGSSIITSGGTPSSSTMGADNEFQILFR